MKLALGRVWVQARELTFRMELALAKVWAWAMESELARALDWDEALVQGMELVVSKE